MSILSYYCLFSFLLDWGIIVFILLGALLAKYLFMVKVDFSLGFCVWREVLEYLFFSCWFCSNLKFGASLMFALYTSMYNCCTPLGLCYIYLFIKYLRELENTIILRKQKRWMHRQLAFSFCGKEKVHWNINSAIDLVWKGW